MFELNLEHLFSYCALLQSPPEVIGAVPDGVRVNFYILGGPIEGPSLRGRMRPVGADFFTIRRDGVGILDVHTTLETHDGALIDTAYSGVGDLGADGYERFLGGELPAILPLRVAARLQTAHPDYLWINRLQMICVGEADLGASTVRYDTYALR